jgi:hypothetical protein
MAGGTPAFPALRVLGARASRRQRREQARPQKTYPLMHGRRGLAGKPLRAPPKTTARCATGRISCRYTPAMHTHAWRLTPDGEYHWERVELPPLQAGEVLIRLRACGLCTGEVMDWYTLRKAPLTPGHELVGEIEALGEGVQGLAVGERVVVHHHAPCLQCDLCRRGAFVHCPTWRSTKLVPWRAERAVHRARCDCAGRPAARA